MNEGDAGLCRDVDESRRHLARLRQRDENGPPARAPWRARGVGEAVLCGLVCGIHLEDLLERGRRRREPTALQLEEPAFEIQLGLDLLPLIVVRGRRPRTVLWRGEIELRFRLRERSGQAKRAGQLN